MASFEVSIDRERCKGCEECLEICTAGVFEMQDSRCLPLNVRACVGCRSCVEVCQEDAINVTENQPRMSETCLALLRRIL
jgi:NAD-dependent dihydropyrimidine dehydrogenase PreA subunit